MATKIGALGTLLCGSTGAVISTGCYLQVTSFSKKSENQVEDTTPEVTEQPVAAETAHEEAVAEPEVRNQEEEQVEGEHESMANASGEEAPTETKSNESPRQVQEEAKAELSTEQKPSLEPEKPAPATDNKEKQPTTTCSGWFFSYSWWCKTN